MNLNQTQASFSIWDLIKRYWFLIFTIICLMPTIVLIITDPGTGIIKFAEKLLTADNLINKDVNLLKTNPSQLIGMDYPTSGAYLHFIYYLRVFYYVILEIITNLWILFFPMSIIYWFIGHFNHEIRAKNLFISFIIFLVYLFISNAILLFIDSSLTIPTDLNKFQSAVFVIKNILPFHGTLNLIIYLISLVKQ